MSRGRHFTEAEDAILREVWKERPSQKRLLEALPGRPIGSIISRARLLKLGRRRERIAISAGDPLLSRLRANHTLADATREFLE